MRVTAPIGSRFPPHTGVRWAAQTDHAGRMMRATSSHAAIDWEAVCRVEGEYNRVIWYAPWDAMDNEGQHYLAQVAD